MEVSTCHGCDSSPLWKKVSNILVVARLFSKNGVKTGIEVGWAPDYVITATANHGDHVFRKSMKCLQHLHFLKGQSAEIESTMAIEWYKPSL